MIWLVQLLRLLWRLTWFVITHPLLDVVAGLVVLTWLHLGWPGLVGLVAVVVAGLVALRLAWPDWYARLIADPVRDWWRWLFYRRRWNSAMMLAGLAPHYRGRVMLPVLAEVQAAGAVDLVTVGLVTGQAPKDFADRADNLAHAFGAHLCRIRANTPGLAASRRVDRHAGLALS